ncbi:GNAT family N-acetyltransferase [Actinomadura sp. NEAU-AAG7]|uniref:GNAT family N-acetyltransferase n=1 Tax=Actinomadura sp. NEAU-AAG7 TaxID=2839640 RepID=UPI001BE3DBD9|nr:GNAT family N-acetyltransferase [Actinomadura sp. NEAU-AAG7]MBT2207033.1 GNAT family N-acetyltransferase [Actinomadura sp. NEAU-AAG7]
MSDEFAVSAHDRSEALDLLDELADLYQQVYAEPPYNAGPKFSRARFLDRTRGQTLASGFRLLVARREAVAVGFAFGFSMMPGAWWANASPPPREVLEADKYAVVELAVSKPERGRGLGRLLLNRLLAERPERFATLAAVLESEAYGMYLRWGWEQVGEFRVEPPFSDALVLELRRNGGQGPT